MASNRFTVCGLDLGQAHDPSAFCVLNCSRVLVPGERALVTQFECPWLKRWPLGTSYVAVAADVEEMLKQPPLVGCDLVIDASGVGRPVYDLFKQKILRAKLHGVIITAGLAETKPAGQPFHHVAKAALIGVVQVALQQRRLQFAASLPEVQTLVEEFRNYRVKITPALNEAFNAREGKNDDLLLSICVAAWLATRHPPVEGFAPYRLGGNGFHEAPPCCPHGAFKPWQHPPAPPLLPLPGLAPRTPVAW
jgi:hypothetical protein